MKRLFGLIIGAVGLAAAGWGVFHIVGGNSHAHMVGPLNALTGGLLGLLLLVIGFVWSRD